MYLATIASTGIAAARRSPPAVAATVPLVLATMHISAGVGFLRGMRRFGVPWVALARVIGIPGLDRLVPPTAQEPVYAPSLDVS